MISCSCGGAGCKLCAGKNPPTLFIPIVPMGAVRTTQKQAGWGTEAGKKYAAYKMELALKAATQIKPVAEGKPIIITDLTFYMPMNESGETTIKVDGKRRKIRQMEDMPHIKKPDIDNLIKGLFDALNGVAWVDDAQVYKITNPRKVYSEYPGIEFGIEYMDI